MNPELLKRLTSKTTTVEDFNFDNMVAPPLLSFITVDDINYFHKLATSIKYSADINFKYSEIDRIMKIRGFVKLSAGTNRVVYRCLENPNIVLKIAIDDVGVGDNPREFQNQYFLKPYVTKVFEVSPCGTVAVVERVNNIKSREEFMSIADDIYNVISKWLVGKYVLEDFGTKFFLNWATRDGFGPVLLDYPYVYELDGNKLFCQIIDDKTGQVCNGTIDYDDGFNHLYCSKCGAIYKATELKKAIENNLLIEKGKREIMKVVVKRGNKVVRTNVDQKTTKKISKRERIYNNLPTVSDGVIVTRKGGSTVPTLKDVIEKNEPVEEVLHEEEIKNEESEIVEEFDTSSKFIPPMEEIPEEENESKDEETEEETFAESIAHTIEEALHESEEEIETFENNTEEHEKEENEESIQFSDVPVGAVPVGKNNLKRSQRFNPDFYK